MTKGTEKPTPYTDKKLLRLAFLPSHPSSKRRSMDGARFHPPWVGDAGGRLNRKHGRI